MKLFVDITRENTFINFAFYLLYLKFVLMFAFVFPYLEIILSLLFDLFSFLFLFFRRAVEDLSLFLFPSVSCEFDVCDQLFSFVLQYFHWLQMRLSQHCDRLEHVLAVPFLDLALYDFHSDGVRTSQGVIDVLRYLKGNRNFKKIELKINFLFEELKLAQNQRTISHWTEV